MGVPGSGQDQAIIHRHQGAVFSAGGSAGGLMAVRRVITGPRADITRVLGTLRRWAQSPCAYLVDALKPALTGASRGRPGSLHVGMDRAAVDAAPEHGAAETEPSCARSQNKRTFTTTWRAFERLDRTNDRCWGQSGRSRGGVWHMAMLL